MSSTREDQLLHKLRHCLAPHSKEEPSIQDLNTLKNNYCVSKENPHERSANRYQNKQYQHYQSKYQGQTPTLRDPLGPYTYNRSIQIHNYQQINSAHHQDTSKRSRSPQRDKQIKRYEYGLGLGLGLKNNTNAKKLPSQQHITSSNYGKTKNSSKNYRQQVKKRQYFLQKQEEAPLKDLKPKYDYPFTQQTIYRYRGVSQDIKAKEPCKRKESKQSFAQSKLNRIAELNEKINQRIKSIINIFESK